MPVGVFLEIFKQKKEKESLPHARGGVSCHLYAAVQNCGDMHRPAVMP